MTTMALQKGLVVSSGSTEKPLMDLMDLILDEAWEYLSDR
jgi:hypothetical protein